MRLTPYLASWGNPMPRTCEAWHTPRGAVGTHAASLCLWITAGAVVLIPTPAFSLNSQTWCEAKAPAFGGNRHMDRSRPNDFSCPHCQARYKTVRVPTEPGSVFQML